MFLYIWSPTKSKTAKQLQTKSARFGEGTVNRPLDSKFRYLSLTILLPFAINISLQIMQFDQLASCFAMYRAIVVATS